MRLSGHDVVCLSSLGWEDPQASAPHYLMGLLAEMNHVLFVDPPHDAWPPRWDGWGRSRLQKRAHNLHVLTPPAVAPDSPWGHWCFLRALRHACAELGMTSPILWIDPCYRGAERVVGTLHETLLLVHHARSRELGEPAFELLERAELAFVAERNLYARWSPQIAGLRLAPNGIDFAFFNRAMVPETPDHPQLASLPRPIVTYMGPLDQTFHDSLWAQVAMHRPDWSFVTVGPFSPTRTLSHGSNLHHLGPLPHSAWLGVLKATSVLAFPFRHGERTAGALGMAEAFAAGKPVVTTERGEAPEQLWSPHEPRDFLRGLEAALEAPAAPAMRERMEWAQRQTWEGRCRSMEEAILDVLAVKTKPSSIPLLVERIVRQGA